MRTPTTSNPFVAHHIARPGEGLPALTGLYDYVLAADGLFLRARRAGLSVTLPIAPCPVRGLATVEARFTLRLPRVPLALTEDLLAGARAERDARGRPVEVMYHLTFADGAWELTKPAQIQTRTAVQAVGPFAGTSYASYLIEVHSHHALDFHDFSTTDDASEGTKFRFFSLLTDIFKNPTLRLRLNVYGYRLTVPASLLFELPEELASTTETDERLAFCEMFTVQEAADA